MQICQSCGAERRDWRWNQGRGSLKEGELYCCEGCVEGTGCICLDEPLGELGVLWKAGTISEEEKEFEENFFEKE